MDQLPFTLFDLAVVAVVLLSAVFAFSRGAVREVLAIGGWIGAALAVFYVFPHIRQPARELLVPLLPDNLPRELLADAAAGAATFLVALLALSLLAHSAARQVQQSRLGPLDRSLGFLYGLLRGALVVCVAYLGLTWAFPPGRQPDWLREAQVRPLVHYGADWLKSVVPEGARESGRELAEEAREEAERARRGGGDLLEQPKIEVPIAAPPGYDAPEDAQLEQLIKRSDD
jgi:membrane protein required for colicin V production